ncbi:MAG: hypothetical protein QM486_10955 [Flavobacteriaceae bacterium]
MSYILELIIVTTGVLIALFLSNLKENNQAQNYHKASIEMLNKEVEANYVKLKRVYNKHLILNDTLMKYRDTSTVIGEIILGKSNGLQVAELSNAGLDLYKINQINLIDFEMISKLYEIDFSSKLLDTKTNALIDFMYKNILDNSKNNKLIFLLHIQNVLDSERHLMKLYKDYIDKNIDIKDTEK